MKISTSLMASEPDFCIIYLPGSASESNSRSNSSGGRLQCPHWGSRPWARGTARLFVLCISAINAVRRGKQVEGGAVVGNKGPAKQSRFPKRGIQKSKCG